MTTAPPALQVEDRIAQVLHHLGISRAHVGGGYAADAVSPETGLSRRTT